MTTNHRPLMAVANGQLGVLTREQAHAVGFSDRQLRSRVQSGLLTQAGVNVFRVAGAPDTAHSQLLALTLDIGGDVVASGPTAAALHGFDGYSLQPPFHVTIGRQRNVSRVAHHVHTTNELDPIDREELSGIPCTRGARTLIDLARFETPEQLTIAMDSGLRDGKFSEASLHRRIVALRATGRSGIPMLLDVIAGCEAIAGAHSWLEREFLSLVSAAGLPMPACQVVLSRAGDKLVRVDFVFAGSRVVVEVLGYTWHRDKAHLRRDTERMNALIADGYQPYQFTYETIVEQPRTVINTLAIALASCSA